MSFLKSQTEEVLGISVPFLFSYIHAELAVTALSHRYMVLPIIFFMYECEPPMHLSINKSNACAGKQSKATSNAAHPLSFKASRQATCLV
jgi:hypothetical protein